MEYGKSESHAFEEILGLTDHDVAEDLLSEWNAVLHRHWSRSHFRPAPRNLHPTLRAGEDLLVESLLLDSVLPLHDPLHDVVDAWEVHSEPPRVPSGELFRSPLRTR